MIPRLVVQRDIHNTITAPKGSRYFTKGDNLIVSLFKILTSLNLPVVYGLTNVSGGGF